MTELDDVLESAANNTAQNKIKAAYGRLFATQDGIVVLNNLREQFYDCLLTGSDTNSQTELICKAAQHDVVAVILKMIGEQNDI